MKAGPGILVKEITVCPTCVICSEHNFNFCVSGMANTFEVSASKAVESTAVTADLVKLLL